jgi:hypothetical protein
VIQLYHGGGSSEVDIEGPAMPAEEWHRLKGQAARLLRARGHVKAADVLDKVPFELSEATNFFGDHFSVLHTTANVERYTRFEELKAKPEYASAFTHIAKTISEIGRLYVRFIIVQLETDDAPAPVEPPSLLISSASVERALEDVTLLLRSSASGPASAVDRTHTALHGYLRAACDRAGISMAEDDTLAQLFKKLRASHPAFVGDGPRADDIRRVMNALATIFDALGPLRNKASIAHPNESLLAEAEAMLVINTARTLLHYLDAKLG